MDNITYVDKRKFIEQLDLLPEISLKYISTTSEYWCVNNHYVLNIVGEEVLSGIRLEMLKNNNIWLHSFFSVKPGSGKILLTKIVEMYMDSTIPVTLRLNCIGDKLETYYSKFGFETYLTQPCYVKDLEDKIYREMMLTKELYAKKNNL